MIFSEFIKYIVNFNNVDDILDTCITASEKGFVYEGFWDFIIKFGFCTHFPNSQFIHITGNVNTGRIKELKSYNEYLTEKVISGNSSGCSDITVYNEATDTFTFFSCKYHLNEKNVESLDVGKLISMIDHNKHIYTNYNIVLLVNDKGLVLEKIKKANKSSRYITKYMKLILDKSDLNKSFLQFKMDFLKHENFIYENFIYGNSKKESLQPRFHQELFSQRTSDLISMDHKSFLWACKCRSGKTYMVGILIPKLKNPCKPLNVMVVTPAPTETIPQFTDDLFNKFKDFEKFNIVLICKQSDFNNLTGDNIFIVSKQFLQNHIDKKLNLPELDVIFFDENHYTGTTSLSKSIIKTYSSAKTININLTATYNKTLREWNIPEECQMYWDIEDEQLCKNINIDGLRKKHGIQQVDKTIKHFVDLGFCIETIFGQYKIMPELSLMTTMFDGERYNEIKEKIMGSKYGFSFETLLSLNNQRTKFKFESEVKLWLRYISGSQKEIDFKNGDKSMFARIFRVCCENESRKPFTQIWYLPSDNINQISTCLEKLIKLDNVLKRYNIQCINRKNNQLPKDVKIEIATQEKIAKADGKDGLILLAGNMLTLGITLELCDLVVLANDSLSCDKVFQEMYRSMTEAHDKKYGFVVDMNIGRVLHTCINYTNCGENAEDKIKYIVDHNLINIDIDYLQQKQIDTQAIVSKLMDIWKTNPINALGCLMRSLENDCNEYDNNTQNLINKLFTSSVGDKKVNCVVEFKDEELQILPSGTEKVQTEKVETEKVETEKVNLKISFTKDVLAYIIPLSCILTMRDTNKDFVKMLNDIKQNPELLETFDYMCLQWWNKRDLIDIIKNIVYEYFNKNSNTFNISISFKMSLHSLINSPVELLNLINECLKPKQKEKQENGEVFTPMEEINEQLDELDIYYKGFYGKSIFTETKFKWFDPAAGMGNFIVAVYLRLLEGLKSSIPCEQERKKFITEQMLYMSEINKKNCFVIKQIFNANNEFNLNLFEGDTLTINTELLWNVKSFHIILGNPPYNKGGIRSHTGKHLGEKNETIWPKFVEQAFQLVNPEGFIVFINPLSWLKKSHYLHSKMLSKHIVRIKLWDNIKSLSTINGKIPISLYILHFITIQKETLVISEIKSKKLKTVSYQVLNPKYSIPIAHHGIFNKLISFIERHGLTLEYNTKTVKSSGTQVKFSNCVGDNWAIDTYTLQNGLMVKKAIQEHPDKDNRKLIIANKSSFAGAFIDQGGLSLTGTDKFYILGDNLELILKLLQFKIINVISHFTKYRQDFLEKEAFTWIPDIRKLNITDIAESRLYELIGFSPEEIEQF